MNHYVAVSEKGFDNLLQVLKEHHWLSTGYELNTDIHWNTDKICVQIENGRLTSSVVPRNIKIENAYIFDDVVINNVTNVEETPVLPNGNRKFLNFHMTYKKKKGFDRKEIDSDEAEDYTYAVEAAKRREENWGVKLIRVDADMEKILIPKSLVPFEIENFDMKIVKSIKTEVNDEYRPVVESTSKGDLVEAILHNIHEGDLQIDVPVKPNNPNITPSKHMNELWYGVETKSFTVPEDTVIEILRQQNEFKEAVNAVRQSNDFVDQTLSKDVIDFTVKQVEEALQLLKSSSTDTILRERLKILLK